MLGSLKKYILKNKALVLLIIGYILIRLPLLDHAFLLRGERDIVLTGYSLLKTGKDFYGNFLPLQFFGLDQPSPLLSFYFSALGWIIFPIKNIFFARLPFLLAGSLNLFFIYEIIQFLTKNKKLSLITAALFGFSPGMYHLGMLALEINLAMPLLLAGILFYVKKRKFLGWVLFARSFFTYNGFRPLIPFLLIYLEFFEFIHKGSWKSFIKNSFLQGILFIAFFAITFFFIDGEIMTSRSTDLVFLSYGKISPEVDFLRNTSIAPPDLKSLMNNKVTETLTYMVDVFYEGISLQYLFFRGDRAAIYTSTFAGQFFSIFVFFYFLGFVRLGARLRKNYFYILGLIPVAMVPSVVNIDYISVAIRSLLASVSYAFVIALGVLMFVELLKRAKKEYRMIAYGIVLLLLTVEVLYFSYNYVLRRPVTMFESYFEHEKQVAQYIIDSDQHVTLYDDSPKNIITAYHILNPDVDIQALQAVLLHSEDVYETDAFTMRFCPQSGDKDQMYVQDTVIAESCLDPEEYDVLEADQRHGRIDFKDFSLNSAFFIYEEMTPSIEPIP